MNKIIIGKNQSFNPRNEYIVYTQYISIVYELFQSGGDPNEEVTVK